MNQKQAIALLKKHSSSNYDFNKVLAHSKAVQRAAVRIAKQTKADVEFIKIASILHDIGRFKCKPHTKKSVRHGVEGGKILRKEKLPELAKVAERHEGVGISKKDIIKQRLPLPHHNYLPKTKEEKIIAYADGLIFDTRKGTIKQVIERFEKELGKYYTKRIISLHNKLIKEGMKAKRL